MHRTLTGDACVEALLRAGFRIRSRGNGLAFLVRGSSMVMIPDVGVIEADMLTAILRSASVSRTELESHLTHVPTRSGFFARQRGEDASNAASEEPKARVTAPPPPKTRRG